MTESILDRHRLDDPRITDSDIANAVREYGFNKVINGNSIDETTHTYWIEKVLRDISDLALKHSAKRETST